MSKATAVRVIFPKGALGASLKDSALERTLRKIALTIDPQNKEWSSKYGATFRNDTFMMHRYCWCEDETNCPWCNPEIHFPNFVYHKRVKDDMNLAVWWYKYIGRGTEASQKFSVKQLKEMEKDCIKSIKPVEDEPGEEEGEGE